MSERLYNKIKIHVQIFCVRSYKKQNFNYNMKNTYT